MKAVITAVGLAAVFSSCAVSKDPQRRTALLLQKGKIAEDTSWVYTLPYKEGKSLLLSVPSAFVVMFYHSDHNTISRSKHPGSLSHFKIECSAVLMR